MSLHELGQVAWLVALVVLEAVQAGRLRLPFMYLRPAGGNVEGCLM